MAPEDTNGASSNQYYPNWLSFTMPHLEMLLRPCGEINVSSSSSSSSNNNNKSNSVSNHHLSLPLPNPSAYGFHHDDADSSPNYFFHALAEWQPPLRSVDGNGKAVADNPENAQMPKLEDFLGGHRSSPSNPCPGAAVAETQDSSLGTIYDYHHHYDDLGLLYHHHDLRAIAAPATFRDLSGNSVSEVEDSASVTGNKLAVSAHSLDSGAEMALTCAHPLAVVVSGSGGSSEKGLVAKTTTGSAQRTSVYRGVTRHRWTGRYEAHLWDNTCRREGQKRKGRQVYLGGYDTEGRAARAYDLAALKYWGPTASTNFPASNYSQEIEEMKHMTKQEFIASLRRKSSGFSRGASVYRGVTRHHQHGRWQARIGRVAGNKDLYLGTFTTEEEAAEAYDVAAIKFRGVNAVTNFELGRYDMEAIAGSDLPIGNAAKRLKLSAQANNPSLQPSPTADSPAAPPQQNNVAASFLNSLLQLHPFPGSPGYMAYGNSSVEPAADPCGQSFFWPTDNTQHNHQINGNILQLTHALHLQ